MFQSVKNLGRTVAGKYKAISEDGIGSSFAIDGIKWIGGSIFGLGGVIVFKEELLEFLPIAARAIWVWLTTTHGLYGWGIMLLVLFAAFAAYLFVKERLRIRAENAAGNPPEYLDYTEDDFFDFRWRWAWVKVFDADAELKYFVRIDENQICPD